MEEVLGCQKYYLRVGSLVRVIEPVANFPESVDGPFALVTELGEQGVYLDVAGQRRRAPATSLLLCRKDTDQLDAKGRPLAVGQAIMVSCYGGSVSRNDIGGRGSILALGKTKAKVRITSDYEKVKSVPFDYLLRTG